MYIRKASHILVVGDNPRLANVKLFYLDEILVDDWEDRETIFFCRKLLLQSLGRENETGHQFRHLDFKINKFSLLISRLNGISSTKFEIKSQKNMKL